MNKLLFALLIAAAPVQASPAPQSITVKVNGLVCDFCARSIEAMLKKRPDVERVHVDLDRGEVHLAVRANSTLDDPTLTRLVTDSGYAVSAIQRSPR